MQRKIEDDDNIQIPTSLKTKMSGSANFTLRKHRLKRLEIALKAFQILQQSNIAVQTKHWTLICKLL